MNDLSIILIQYLVFESVFSMVAFFRDVCILLDVEKSWCENNSMTNCIFEGASHSLYFSFINLKNLTPINTHNQKQFHTQIGREKNKQIKHRLKNIYYYINAYITM